MTQWWDPSFGILMGIIGGPASGLFGAAIGVIAGLSKGRFKGLVYGMHAIGFLSGAVCLAGLSLALSSGQPFHVWFPLAIIGMVNTAVFGSVFFVTRQAYRKAEGRRFEAEQLRRYG